MQFLKRQYHLQNFIIKLKRIFDNPEIANNYVSRNWLYRRVVWDYFGKINPLEDKENIATFPWATSNFKKAAKNGHNLESMENNLDFLKKEYDSYFEELLDKGVIKENKDTPPQYFLNRNSPRVYWEIVVLDFFRVLLKLVPAVIKKSY